jgi:hypothetical protein
MLGTGWIMIRVDRLAHCHCRNTTVEIPLNFTSDTMCTFRSRQNWIRYACLLTEKKNMVQSLCTDETEACRAISRTDRVLSCLR